MCSYIGSLDAVMEMELSIVCSKSMCPQRLSVFGLLIMESARHMQDHWDVYQKAACNGKRRKMDFLYGVNDGGSLHCEVPLNSEDLEG